MPQLWLTFEELALFTGQPVGKVRAVVKLEGWDHRLSRDGQMRIKLPPMHMANYICTMAEYFGKNYISREGGAGSWSLSA